MIEHQIINYILDNGIKGFKSNWFTELRPHFDYIDTFLQKYGKIPDKPTFIDKFKDFKCFEVNDPVSSLIDRLKEEALYKNIIPVYNKAYELISEGKSGEACRLLVDRISVLEKELSSGLPPVDLSDAAVKKALYKQLKTGMTKFSTGRPELDAQFGGWNSRDFILIFARLGIGKQQPNSCEILTPTGSIKFGEVKVGDEILGIDGKSQIVKTVIPQESREVYRVTFNDGSSTLCGPEHLWTIKHWSRRKGIVEEVLTLKQMIDSGKFDRRPWLPEIKPPEYTEKEFKCDPYVLGAFLGDGCCKLGLREGYTDKRVPDRSLHLSASGPQVPEAVAKRIGAEVIKKSKASYTWSFFKEGETYFKQSEILPEEICGLGSHEKYIPEEYFYGSVEQRIDLLRGLMDTDGSACPSGRLKGRNKVQYSSVSKALAEGVVRLARSLGLFATIREHHRIKTYKGISKEKTSYSVSINSKEINPFLIEGKASVWTPATKYLTRRFESAERVQDEDCTCIVVSNPDMMYLTNDYIPTHNSWISEFFAYCLVKLGKRVGYYSGEMSAVEISLRMDTFHTNLSNSKMFNGGLSEAEYDKVADSFSALPGKFSVITPEELGGPASVEDIKKFIETKKLEAVFIDQISLMKRNTKLSSTEGITQLSNELRILQTITGIPFFVVSQQNRASLQDSDSKGKDDLVASISLSDSLGQNATLAFCLNYNPENRILALNMVKSRRTKSEKFQYSWDIDKGTLRYIPLAENDDESSSTSEDEEDLYGDGPVNPF